MKLIEFEYLQILYFITETTGYSTLHRSSLTLQSALIKLNAQLNFTTFTTLML
jgi:hypothetical protein